MRLSSRILWFGIAGGVGFVVDGGILTLLALAGMEPRIARLISFSVGMVATWLINRSHTFRDRVGPPSLGEFGRYALASSLAAAVNLGIFMALVTLGGVFRAWPVTALVIATAFSMFVNFLSYLKLVFAEKR